MSKVDPQTLGIFLDRNESVPSNPNLRTTRSSLQRNRLVYAKPGSLLKNGRGTHCFQQIDIGRTLMGRMATLNL